MMERTFKTVPKTFGSLIKCNISDFLIQNEGLPHSHRLHPFTRLSSCGFLLLADVHETSEFLGHVQP